MLLARNIFIFMKLRIKVLQKIINKHFPAWRKAPSKKQHLNCQGLQNCTVCQMFNHFMNKWLHWMETLRQTARWMFSIQISVQIFIAIWLTTETLILGIVRIMYKQNTGKLNWIEILGGTLLYKQNYMNGGYVKKQRVIFLWMLYWFILTMSAKYFVLIVNASKNNNDKWQQKRF